MCCALANAADMGRTAADWKRETESARWVDYKSIQIDRFTSSTKSNWVSQLHYQSVDVR